MVISLPPLFVQLVKLPVSNPGFVIKLTDPPVNVGLVLTSSRYPLAPVTADQLAVKPLPPTAVAAATVGISVQVILLPASGLVVR